MHFRHKGAGGVEDAKAARFGFARDRKRHAVRREDERGAFGHFCEVVNEDGAAGAQVFDHGAVVHDFMAHVYGGAVNGKRALDDRNGARDAGAEAARLCEKNLHGNLSFREMGARAKRRVVRTAALKSRIDGSAQKRRARCGRSKKD